MWSKFAASVPSLRTSVLYTIQGPGLRFVSKCTWEVIQRAETYLAPMGTVLPVILKKGKGVYVYGTDGKYYIDFIAGNGSLGLGHSNLKLMKVAVPQMKKLAVTSKKTFSKVLTRYAQQLTETFCFDKVLPCCTGCEAIEMAVKLGRKWGYRVKGITPGMAKVVFAENNSSGTSLTAISVSSNPALSEEFGPCAPGMEVVPFNNPDYLNGKLKDPNVCAFVVEPILYEGAIVPDATYMKKVRDLCTDNNVLFVANEIHCGLGRAGSLICSDLFEVRPDILVVGEMLTGGIVPASALLADKDVMDVLEPGCHHSPFAGSPLSCQVASAVLRIVREEKLAENAREMGAVLREELCQLPENAIEAVRGEGLLNAIVVHEDVDACQLSTEFLRNGLITEPPRNRVIRMTPPINIREKEVLKACQIIRKSVTCLRAALGKDKCSKLNKARKRSRKPGC